MRPEIDVEVFDLGGPGAAERCLNAAADRPTGAGRVELESARDAGVELVDGRSHVAICEAAGVVVQHRAINEADARSRRAEPRHLCVTAALNAPRQPHRQVCVSSWPVAWMSVSTPSRKPEICQLTPACNPAIPPAGIRKKRSANTNAGVRRALLGYGRHSSRHWRRRRNRSSHTAPLRRLGDNGSDGRFEVGCPSRVAGQTARPAPAIVTTSACPNRPVTQSAPVQTGITTPARPLSRRRHRPTLIRRVVNKIVVDVRAC